MKRLGWWCGAMAVVLCAACGFDGGAGGPDGLGATDDGLSRVDAKPTQVDGGVGPDGARPDGGADGAAPDAAYPPLAVPDIADITVGCGTGTISDITRARAVYDTTFGTRLPRTEEDFGWHEDPALLTPAHVQRIAFPALAEGLPDADYHAYFDWNPTRFARSTSASNWDLFGSLPAGDATAPYRLYNPTDWVPATATHYATAAVNDVMANQLVYQLACNPTKMADAFARCPDCVDVFVPLSRHDLHKIFEVKFVRVSGGKLQVSRTFKLLSIDASGHMFIHATIGPYYFATVGGTALRAYRRSEISGQLATILGEYGGPAPTLVRVVATEPYPDLAP